MTAEQYAASIFGRTQQAHFRLRDQEDCCMAVGREFGFYSEAFEQEKAIESKLFAEWAALWRQCGYRELP